MLNSQHTVDLADLFRCLDEEDRTHNPGLLAESLAAGVLAEFNPSKMVSVATQLDDRALSGIVEEMEDRSVLRFMRHRWPWLLFCLVGTLLSGGVLDLFSGVLAILSSLVLFVPAIMAMGGNSGIQTSTVTVRSLATGILLPEQVHRALWRELRVATLMGMFLGLVVFAVAYVWTDGSTVAPCAGIAMFAAVVLSAVLGATNPIIFRVFGIDPAVDLGPMIKTVNDILFLGIYSGVASALLQLRD